MITATELSTKIVTIARGFAGDCACAPYRPLIYDAVGMYFDPRPFRVVDGRAIGMSTCYAFALNVLRLAGVAVHTWHLGEPIGAMIAWAKRNGCWQTPGDGLCPGPGDVIVIGPRGGTHVAVVVDCDGAMLWTIDGGQVCRRTDDGHEGIGRQLIDARSRIWWGDRAGGDLVVGWVVCGLSPLANNVGEDSCSPACPPHPDTRKAPRFGGAGLD